jgi:hypothetical protein
MKIRMSIVRTMFERHFRGDLCVERLSVALVGLGRTENKRSRE